MLSYRVISYRVIVIALASTSPRKEFSAAITIQLINVSNYSHLILILFHDIASCVTTSSPFIMASVCRNAFASTKTTLHILLRPHTRIEKLINSDKKKSRLQTLYELFLFLFFILRDFRYFIRHSQFNYRNISLPRLPSKKNLLE